MNHTPKEAKVMHTANIVLFFTYFYYIKLTYVNTLNMNSSLKSCTSFNVLRIIFMNFAEKIFLAALISAPCTMAIAAETNVANLPASEAVAQEAPASESAVSEATAEQTAK